MALYLPLVCGTLLSLGILLQPNNTNPKSINVSVPISSGSWKVLFSEDKCEDTQTSCPADPKATQLWHSSIMRASPNYRALLTERGDRAVWLGAQVASNDLKRAIAEDATVLFLGRMFSKYSIWINGVRTSHVTDVLDAPVFLHLRTSDFKSDQGLFLAIRFENTNKLSHPDLDNFLLGEIGFYKPSVWPELQRSILFHDWGRPFAFSLINFLLALAFFIFWRSAPIKQEYLWFSAYAFLLAILQLVNMTPVILRLASIDAPLKLSLKIWECSFPLLLGLSFIRVRRQWIVVATLSCFFLSLLSAILGRTPERSIVIQQLLSIYGTPVMALIGAALCVANSLFITMPSKRKLQVRIFGFCLFMIGALYTQHELGTVHRTVLLVLTGALGSFVFWDFKDMVKQLRKVPLSKYHRDEQLLNQPVLGFVASFDLKRSEQLVTHAHSKISPGEVLARAIYPFRVIFNEYGAIEIALLGDSILAFFPAQALELDKVITDFVPKLINAQKTAMALLESDRMVPPNWSVQFRLAITHGELIPSLYNSGAEERAEWAETQEMPLTELARLLEIEKEAIDPKKTTSCVIYSNTIAKALKNNPSTQGVMPLLGKAGKTVGKHNKEWSYHYKIAT